MATSTAPPKIGVIIGSQRSPRAGPEITRFVLDAINQTNPAATIALIDLAEWNLPLLDEPDMASNVKSADGYAHEHTRRWSAEISSCAGFVFVTPQYNWGYPASLKNALDYLFYEWRGKPGMIVSYGGRGGAKSAAQLVQVLQGLRITAVERMVALAFPGKQFLHDAATGQKLDFEPEGAEPVWAAEREEIKTAFGELLALLEKPSL